MAKIAAEYQVDLSQVRGTGTGGRITKKDVLAHVRDLPAAGSIAPAWEQPASGELFRPTEEVFGRQTSAVDARPGPGRPLTNSVRRQIAEHMLRSRRTSPHVTTVMEADLSRVVAHRQAHKETFAREGVDLTFSAYFVVAAVAALKAVPWVNASWSDEGIVLHRQVHIGVAVSLGRARVDRAGDSGRRPEIAAGDRRRHQGPGERVHGRASSSRTRCRGAPSPSPIMA